jgi:hypothetical protein
MEEYIKKKKCKKARVENHAHTDAISSTSPSFRRDRQKEKNTIIAVLVSFLGSNYHFSLPSCPMALFPVRRRHEKEK